MNKRLQIWLPLILSGMMVVGMFIGYKLHESVGGTGFFSSMKKNSMQEVLDLVRMKYVDNVDTDTISSAAINGVLHRLDPHSLYIPPEDLEYINDDLKGGFSGIGIEFQVFDDTLNVVNVIPGGPSEKAGVQVGDKFIKVNDTVSIAGKKLNPDKIRKLLRGSQGSPVKVSVLRDGKLISIIINRGLIPVPSVDAAYMINPTTGFIHVNRFAENTYPEFMKELEKLQARKMQKLILDLRGNGGGLLSQAVDLADEFLDDGKMIVYTKGEHVPRYEYTSKREGLFEKGDIVLLVDESSASASEVLAGALQDWDRATIVGRRTFGKGLVQEQFALSGGAALRLTVARYYTPLGRNIQKPYVAGYDKYEEEVMDRFQSGEVVHGDTTRKTGHPYKTPKGRLVYGGGGITPDIYVPFDTSAMGPNVMKLYTRGTLSNFIYTYFIQHKAQLAAYKKSSELYASFKAGETEWNALKSFATRDSVDLSKASEKDKAFILKKMPSLLARQIWRYQGYYEVMNQTDEFVQKALEILK